MTDATWALQQARQVGPIAPPKAEAQPIKKLHTGPLHSSVAGRTDHLPSNVENGSYILPADIVSGFGEGNSLAGFKVLKNMFSDAHRDYGSPPYGGGSPTPYSQGNGPYGVHESTGGQVKSSGEYVPVAVAGGEHALGPKEVRWAGMGDLEAGHRVLDEFVLRQRKLLIKTLKKLPGPKRD